MQGAAKRTVIGTRTVLIRVHILKLLLTAHGGPESGCFKLEINEDLCLAPERRICFDFLSGLKRIKNKPNP